MTPYAPIGRPRRLLSYRLVGGLLDLVLAAFACRRYSIGQLPASGALLVAPNHVSLVDPVGVAMALVRAGRTPRFVVTSEVMALPVVGAVLRFFDHIPLDRSRSRDPAVLDPVRRALRHGECVVVYPEGAISKDPGYRPARGQQGLGRLAIELGVPVLPVAQWGAQHIVGRGRLAWRSWPPRRAWVTVRGLPLMQPPVGPADDLNSRRLVDDVLAHITAELERLALVDPPPSRRS